MRFYDVAYGIPVSAIELIVFEVAYGMLRNDQLGQYNLMVIYPTGEVVNGNYITSLLTQRAADVRTDESSAARNEYRAQSKPPPAVAV